MIFSDTSTAPATGKSGIIQNIESLCNLGDGGITNDAVLFAKMTGFVNQAYNKVVAALLSVDKNWKWDDSNYTDFPRGTATLVSGQHDYTLPAATSGGNASELLRINKIAVLDKNSTPQERILTLTNQLEADLNNIYATSGLPTVYKLIGNSVKMWPAPDNNVSVTLTSGLVVYFERMPDQFLSTDTTQQPGFMLTFHDLLPLDAAATYLMPINTRLAQTYQLQFAGRLDMLLDAYSSKNDDVKGRIIPVHRSAR